MIGQYKTEIAIFTAPVAAVLILHFSSQFGPRASMAQPRQFDTPTTAGTSNPTQDSELSRWIASLEIGPDMTSPMDHGPAPQAQIDVPVHIPTPPTPEPKYVNPLKDAVLTSVIGTDTNGLASINGHIYRINESPAPGCRVVSIDAKKQVVGITLATGDMFYLYVNRP
jgi:hypothetical protein